MDRASSIAFLFGPHVNKLHRMPSSHPLRARELYMPGDARGSASEPKEFGAGPAFPVVPRECHLPLPAQGRFLL